MPKIRPKKFLPKVLSRFRGPVLTGAEKSALGILLALLASGASLRAWERSGVVMGPVHDWDSLRRLVIRAPMPKGTYPCADSSNFTSDRGNLPRGFQKTGFKKGTKKGAGPSRPVDINTANEAQLNSLPGVGPSTAKAILAYRSSHAKFTAPEDLMNVKGIGPKKFEALRKFVKVAEEAGRDSPVFPEHGVRSTGSLKTPENLDSSLQTHKP